MENCASAGAIARCYNMYHVVSNIYRHPLKIIPTLDDTSYWNENNNAMTKGHFMLIGAVPSSRYLQRRDTLEVLDDLSLSSKGEYVDMCGNPGVLMFSLHWTITYHPSLANQVQIEPACPHIIKAS